MIPPAATELEELPLEELQQLARSRPKSGRSAAANAAALRILERRARERTHWELPEDLGVTAPDDYWHPGPDEFRKLDGDDTIGTPRAVAGVPRGSAHVTRFCGSERPLLPQPGGFEGLFRVQRL